MSDTARWRDADDADASPSSPHAHAHANDGIALLYSDARFTFAPITRDRFARTVSLGSPIPMPMVPLSEVHRCASFLRSLHGIHGCVGGLALYVDCISGRWLPVFPAQLCAPLSFRANLRSVPRNQLPPGGNWRLAGSIRTIGPSFEEQTLLADTPGFDGVHILIDPRFLLFVRIVLRGAGEAVWEVDPAHMLYEGCSTTDLRDSRPSPGRTSG